MLILVLNICPYFHFNIFLYMEQIKQDSVVQVNSRMWELETDYFLLKEGRREKNFNALISSYDIPNCTLADTIFKSPVTRMLFLYHYYLYIPSLSTWGFTEHKRLGLVLRVFHSRVQLMKSNQRRRWR